MQALTQEKESARATLGQASDDLRRAEENFASHIIPESEIQRARTAVATAGAAARATDHRVLHARATLEGARDTPSKTTARSPIDGIVTAKRLQEGEVAVIGIQ